MDTHLFAVGEIVSLDFHDGRFIAKLNPFTVEAQMPPVGTTLQYRIKSEAESYRRVVSEHQLSRLDSPAEEEPAGDVPTSDAAH